jgi:general secretion pathway protein J
MHNKVGFTLLEILIALFIFTIVSVIMMTTLHMVLTSQSATEKKSMRLTQLQTALILISSDLEQTVDRPIMTSKDTMESFIGTQNSVSFTHTGLANPMGELQRATLQRTEYILNKTELIRVTWPVLDQTSKTQSDQRTLLTNVQDLFFEYLDDQGRFKNNWPISDNNESLLPKAVRMTLKMSDWGTLTQLYILPAQRFSVTSKTLSSSNGEMNASEIKSPSME